MEHEHHERSTRADPVVCGAILGAHVHAREDLQLFVGPTHAARAHVRPANATVSTVVSGVSQRLVTVARGAAMRATSSSSGSE